MVYKVCMKLDNWHLIVKRNTLLRFANRIGITDYIDYQAKPQAQVRDQVRTLPIKNYTHFDISYKKKVNPEPE